MAAASLVVPTFAAPRPQAGAPLPCNAYPAKTAYTVTSQETNVPGPPVIGDYSVLGGNAPYPFSYHESSSNAVKIQVKVVTHFKPVRATPHLSPLRLDSILVSTSKRLQVVQDSVALLRTP